MDHPKFIASNKMEDSISAQRVEIVYLQTSFKLSNKWRFKKSKFDSKNL